MHKLTAVDLFAGTGGLSLGFHMAGFHTLLAVEQDKWAAESYSANFPQTKICVDDITSISPERARQLCPMTPDIIVGGPPCQGFSHSNIVNRDPKDPRNSLFEAFLDWVHLFEPKYFLIENVGGLLTTRTTQGEKIIEVIEREILRIGYLSTWKLMQASDYGVPQNRVRLFIVGAKSKELLNAFTWPMAQVQQPISLWDAISDLPQEEGAYISSSYSSYQKAMRAQNQSLEPTSHEPMRHTARIVERFKSIGYGQSEASVKDIAPVRRGGGGVGRAYGQNSRRQRPDVPCNTIVASSHTNYIHPYFHRNFTVRELMRIQSFPDHFLVKGKRAVLSKKLSMRKGLLEDIYLDQRMQIGNAVPPLLAAALAKAFVRALGCETEISDAA